MAFMNPILLLEKYYPAGTPAHKALIRHSRLVAEKALTIARHISRTKAVDTAFVEEAALLHDIGICFTFAPGIGCYGDPPYLAHGIKGRELLEKEGLFRHALVCERHIGVGLTADEIKMQNLPLPCRDMLPLSLEERIVTYADLFFSKSPDKKEKEKTPEKVRSTLARYGADKPAIFDAWHQEFQI